jgi:response regulator of citrate/malate metabolism
MPRPKGPNPEKIAKIVTILKQNPKGIWIRELARKCKLPKTTVHRYVNEFMQNEIECVFNGGYGFVKIIKLKNK